ncbi:MAG: hypothetical protein PHX05_10550 [Acidobacteriota bacterium]|nr:hypothetical protein [Acidobacteriota bacterium]
MPIQGFNESLRPDRLGKIRLGMKVPSEKDPSKSYPRATPYFVVPPEVAQLYGEKPTEICPVWLPSDNLDDFISHHYEYWTQTNSLVCRGDGVKAMAKLDIETGAFADRTTANWVRREMNCGGEECEYYRQKKCRAMMHFDFLLPEVPGIGVWTLTTGSWNGARNILSSIKALQNMCRMFKDGHIAGIPLTLALAPQEVTPPGAAKKKIYVVHLKIPLKFGDVARLAQTPVGAQFRIAAGPLSVEEAEKDGIPEDLVGPFEEGPEPAETATQSVKTPEEVAVAEPQPATQVGTAVQAARDSEGEVPLKPLAEPLKRGPGRPAGKTKTAAESQAEANARTAQENAQIAQGAPLTSGVDGSPPPATQPAKIDVMALAKDLLGEDGVRVFLMPEMVRLYGTTVRLSDLTAEQTETLAVAVQEENIRRGTAAAKAAAQPSPVKRTPAEEAAATADLVAKAAAKAAASKRDQEVAERPSTPAPETAKEHTALRKELNRSLMERFNKDKDACIAWLKENFHTTTSEAMGLAELKVAIERSKEAAPAGESEPTLF